MKIRNYFYIFIFLFFISLFFPSFVNACPDGYCSVEYNCRQYPQPGCQRKCEPCGGGSNCSGCSSTQCCQADGSCGSCGGGGGCEGTIRGAFL